MRLSNKIVLASNNVGKLEEFQALLASYPELELVKASDLVRNSDKLGYAEVHNTYLENSIAKARLVNQGSHYPSLADDTGLEVDALGGKPGVRSFRYAQVPGRILSKIEQDRANVELLLSELKTKPAASRNARFVTCLALLIEGILIHAEGTLEGIIVDAPRGEFGFGYDSIFQPTGFQKTLAEMSPTEKNTVSHRAKALHALMNQLQSRGIILSKP